jgi:hypothetical protein
VDVFGRGPDFDPGKDPIVRIEATRIRSALTAYYEVRDHHGPLDPVCGGIFRGGSRDMAAERVGRGHRRRRCYFCHIPAPAAEDAPADGVQRAVVVTHRSDRRDRCAGASSAAGAGIWQPKGLVEGTADGGATSQTGMYAMSKGDLYLQAIVRAVSSRGFRVFVTPPPERRAAAQAIKELLSQPDAVLALDVAVHGIAEGCSQATASVTLCATASASASIRAPAGTASSIPSTASDALTSPLRRSLSVHEFVSWRSRQGGREP